MLTVSAAELSVMYRSDRLVHPPDSDAVMQSNNYCSTLVSIILSYTHMQIQACFDVYVLLQLWTLLVL